MAQIQCKNASLGYEGRAVVENLNFTVEKGDYLCIVGENGSGKSTLIKALLHLKTPMEGEIRFGDGLKGGEIGYLPQQTLVQRDFPASVEEIVRSGFVGRMGRLPFYSRKQKAEAENIMEELGILSLKKRCYRDLSGGQQQRTLLARALCATGKMLLLDEPTAGLDPRSTRELYEGIEALNKKGITILMVSHDLESALPYASHVLHIGGRGQRFFGRKEDYVKSETGRFFVKSGEEA